MGSTFPPQHDAQNPYHIPPAYFSPNANKHGGPSSSANPTISRRVSSLSGQQGSGQQEIDTEMFRDAEDDTGSGDYDLGRDLLGFDPPPPRSGPPQPPPAQSGQPVLRSPYEPNRSRSNENQHAAPTTSPPFMQSFPAGSCSGQNSITSPGRDRLQSSTSVSSMSSTLRGNRAPAPAALDLSPKRDQGAKRNQYDGLGHGTPSTEGRRVVTDSYLERVSCSAVT